MMANNYSPEQLKQAFELEERYFTQTVLAPNAITALVQLWQEQGEPFVIPNNLLKTYPSPDLLWRALGATEEARRAIITGISVIHQKSLVESWLSGNIGWK